MVVWDFPFSCRVVRLRRPTRFSRLFRVLPSGPPHAALRHTHYQSAMRFRHLAVRSGLSPVRSMRCQAHKRLVR